MTAAKWVILTHLCIQSATILFGWRNLLPLAPAQAPGHYRRSWRRSHLPRSTGLQDSVNGCDQKLCESRKNTSLGAGIYWNSWILHILEGRKLGMHDHMSHKKSRTLIIWYTNQHADMTIWYDMIWFTLRFLPPFSMDFWVISGSACVHLSCSLSAQLLFKGELFLLTCQQRVSQCWDHSKCP